MLRRILFGGLLDTELRGIDDPAVVRSITHRCICQISKNLNRIDVGIVAAALLVGVVSAKLTFLFLGDSSIGGGYVGGGVMAFAVIFRLKRRLRQVLPDVLASLGRCKSCGYLLRGHSSKNCPECGHSLEIGPSGK